MLIQRFTNVWVSTHGTSTPAGLNGRGSQASRSSDYKSAGREVQNQNVSRKIWWNRVVLRIQDLQWDRHQQSQQRPRDTLDKSLPPEDRTGSSCWKSQLGALCGAGETNSDSTVLGIHRLSPSTLLCVHSHFFWWTFNQDKNIPSSDSGFLRETAALPLFCCYLCLWAAVGAVWNVKRDSSCAPGDSSRVKYLSNSVYDKRTQELSGTGCGLHLYPVKLLAQRYQSYLFFCRRN